MRRLIVSLPDLPLFSPLSVGFFLPFPSNPLVLHLTPPPSPSLCCRYASLYFCCAVEDQDNELITLEIIHRYVELLDKYFGSVSPPVLTPQSVSALWEALKDWTWNYFASRHISSLAIVAL